MNLISRLKWQCYYYNNVYILWLKRNHRRISNILLVLSFPYIVLRWLFIVLYEEIYGKSRIAKLIEKDKVRSFKYELAICAIGKNEGAYLKEWVEYHKLVGIEKIFFYDNESNDNTKEVLKPYVESGFVDYHYQKGKGQQLYVYNYTVMHHKEEYRWIAFIDLDEFIQPMKFGEKIPDIINRLGYKSFAGIGINWCNFGSSGYEHKPEGSTLENFLYRGKTTCWQNRLVKTICNPRLIQEMISPHYPIYKWGGYSVNENDGKRQWCWFNTDVEHKNIRIVHYKVRSKEEFLKKRARGLGDREGMYDLENFNQYDINDVKDLSMKRYAEHVKNQCIKDDESISVK